MLAVFIYYFSEKNFRIIDLSLGYSAIGLRSPTEAEDFSSTLCPQPDLGPTQPTVQWYRGFFPRGKARPGRDADLSHPPSAEVKKEWELYLLFP
jgi:hypothetical protein